MLEIFQNFESTMGGAARLSPIVLIGPGGAAVAVGLFVWLGGLGFKRVLVAIAGAVCGGILGILVIRRGLVFAGVSAAVAAAIAAVSERISIALLAGALAALVSFAVLAGPALGSLQRASRTGPDEASTQTTPVNSGRILEHLKAYAVDIGETVKRAASQMPTYKWAIITASGVVLMAGAFVFRCLVPALCFSVLGTMLVFVGMILLLLYKQAAPVSRIAGQPLIYAGAFAAMTVFGTLEQILLCRGVKVQTGKKKKTAQEKEGTEKRQRSWRAT